MARASSLHVFLVSRAGQPDTQALTERAEPAKRLRDNPAGEESAKNVLDNACQAIRERARRMASEPDKRRLAAGLVISHRLDLSDQDHAAVIQHDLLMQEDPRIADDRRRRSALRYPMDIRNALLAPCGHGSR